MPRYVLVDHSTGTIVADTADVDGPARDEGPVEAVLRMNEVLGLSYRPRSYKYITHRTRETVPLWAEGYHVYLAEIAGRNIIPLIKDGKDEEVLREVRQLCKYCGFVYAEWLEPEARDAGG